MSDELDQTTALIKLKSPSPADVHAHLSIVQVVSLAIAVLSGVLTALQALPSIPWAPPTMTILAALVAALTGWVKAYNVPLIIFCVLLLGLLPGCPPLPANPTPTQISAAQDSITKIELGYIVFTTALDAEIDKPTFDPKKRALIQAAERLFFDELEKAYTAAGKGQNIDAHQLTIDLANFKADVVAIQNGLPPATRPGVEIP